MRRDSGDPARRNRDTNVPCGRCEPTPLSDEDIQHYNAYLRGELGIADDEQLSRAAAARDIFVADPTFDLVLTDFAMPGRPQGTGLAAELRTTRPSLPVIMLSGYADDAIGRTIGLGDHNVRRLTKPVRRDELLRAIESSLAGR